MTQMIGDEIPKKDLRHLRDKTTRRINLRDKEQNMFACKHATNMKTYRHRKPCLRFLY